MQEKKKGRVIQTKVVTINEFRELFNNGTLRKILEEEDLNAIYVKYSFEDTDNKNLLRKEVIL